MSTKVKMKLSEITETYNALNRILNAPITAKSAYRISRALSKVVSIIKDFDKAKQKLLEKYGDKQEKGGYKVPESAEKKAALDDEFEDLLAQETELEIFPIPMNWLDEIRITPAELLALDKFITEPEEEKAVQAPPRPLNRG